MARDVLQFIHSGKQCNCQLHVSPLKSCSLVKGGKKSVNKLLQIWHMVEQLQRLKMTQQLQTTRQNTILHVMTPFLLQLCHLQNMFDLLEVHFLEQGRLGRRKLLVCIYFGVALLGMRKITGRAGGNVQRRDGVFVLPHDRDTFTGNA